MSGTKPKILYFAAEDWFFVSHFLSVAVAAQAAGFDTAVVTRLRDPQKGAVIAEAGVRLIETTHERGHFSPLAVWRHIRHFRDLIRAEKPDVVHFITLRLILLGGAAAILAGVRRRLYAVTGLGLMGASRTAKASLARRAVGLALRLPLGGRGVRYVFENPDDPVTLGLPQGPPKTIVVGGAGIDPGKVQPFPLPEGGPLRMALVARMVASKGVRVAVEATRLARQRGAEVQLSLYGNPDPQNPRSVTRAELEAWSQEPGIAWHGHTADIEGVWRAHHVGLVPSLGGEGLPRTLLEAAGHGRALLTTATPGCQAFARDGVEGFVVPPGDVEALALAMQRMAADRLLVARMCEAARARIFEGFTVEAVANDFVLLYRQMMAR
jgi:glycosyltransferase involved in cell wall biosynthesis